MISVPSLARASQAARILPAISPAGISDLPFRWPQRLGLVWSSSCRALAPMRSKTRTVRWTFSALPKPVSASTTMGSCTRRGSRRWCRRPRSSRRGRYPAARSGYRRWRRPTDTRSPRRSARRSGPSARRRRRAQAGCGPASRCFRSGSGGVAGVSRLIGLAPSGALAQSASSDAAPARHREQGLEIVGQRIEGEGGFFARALDPAVVEIERDALAIGEVGKARWVSTGRPRLIALR